MDGRGPIRQRSPSCPRTGDVPVSLRHALAPHDPDHRSLQKAGRTALVMSAVFLFGRYVVGNDQFAVIGGFTGAALLGIADFSGARRERMRACVTTLLAGAALLALGTAVSTSTAAATITMFFVTFVVGYTAVFSGYFAAASNAVIVFYVVATGVTGPVSTIPAREAGLAVGGALSVLAAGWLWPSKVVAQSRQSLADVYRQLARTTSRLSAREADPKETVSLLSAAVLEAERSIARSAWRPDGLAAPQKARMYLLQGAHRAVGVIASIERLPHDPDGPMHAEAVHLEEALSRSLEACAACLSGGPLPEPDEAEAATARFAEVSRVGFAEQAAAGVEREKLQDVAAETFLLHQLGWGVVLAILHCRAMFNAPIESVGEAQQSWLVSVLFDGPSIRKWIRRARRNLTPRSVHLQNSLRLAVGLAVARLSVGVFDLKHGFWVGFATLVVLKTSAAGTRSSAVQAAAGTAVGFGISTLFIATFGVHDVAYAIVLPIVVFAAFYLPGAVSFVAGQAFFTMVIVVLFNLIKPAGWSVGLLRVEDVLLGAGIGLVIGMAMWPRGASLELRGVVAELFVVASAFARATVLGLVGADPLPGSDEDASGGDFPARIYVAASDVEDVFSQYLGEPHQSDAPVMIWAYVVGAAHRLWFGAAVARFVPSIAPECAASAMASEAVRESTGVADVDYRQVAASLVDASLPSIVPIPPIEVPADSLSVEETLTLMEVETWLGELAGSLEVLALKLGELPRRMRSGADATAAPTPTSISA
jgi:uncharacterized membrane protein YccC